MSLPLNVLVEKRCAGNTEVRPGKNTNRKIENQWNELLQVHDSTYFSSSRSSPQWLVPNNQNMVASEDKYQYANRLKRRKKKQTKLSIETKGWLE